MGDRLSLFLPLPVDMDRHVREALNTILIEHAKQINLGAAIEFETITSSDTVATEAVLADASAGTVVCTLVPALDWRDRAMHIKKIDPSANTVLLVPQAGETVDGAATLTISGQWSVKSILSDGSNWYVL